MHRNIKSFLSFCITACIAAMAVVYPQLTVHAADSSAETDKPGALTIVLFTLLFATALIISTVFTYKSRTKKLRRTDNSDEHKDDAK